MNIRTKNLLDALGVFLLVIGFGAVEDWFGAVVWGADGIAYFDNATAIRQGDWATALNPYWSIGYPLVLASTRWMFPAGWAGDWLAIHVVNLLIFVATYASFLYFLRQAIAYAAKIGGADEPDGQSLPIVGSLVFLEWQVQIKNVSQMTPDLMVSGLFFLLSALSLQFCLRPSIRIALLMGLTAGAGYVTKAAFLPVALFVFLVVAVRIFTQPGAARFPALKKLAWVAPALALLMLPYVLALSLTLGRFTLGESGSLNYAWTVNKLTHWHWTGDAAFGEPLHPLHLLATSPHVYEYAEPIHVTYPPFYNPFHWYEGYRHFFSLGNQIAALQTNLFELNVLFFATPHAPVKAFVTLALLIAAIFFLTKRAIFWRRLLALWPVYVPSLLGTAMYVVVCVEARYIVGFIIVLLMTPLLALFVPTSVASKRVGYGVLIVVYGVCLMYLIKDTRPALERARRLEPYAAGEDWQIGLYLAANGIAPGTKVAMVKVERGIQTTWAFVAGLHVIGQIGNQDFTKEEQKQDFQLFVDTPAVQQNVFDLFRKSGAELVLLLDASEPPKGEGWISIPGTKAWVHRL